MGSVAAGAHDRDDVQGHMLPLYVFAFSHPPALNAERLGHMSCRSLMGGMDTIWVSRAEAFVPCHAWAGIQAPFHAPVSFPPRD